MSAIFNRKITIIGSGRVAKSLANSFYKQGFEIREIYSRTFQNAAQLSDQISGSTPTDSLDFSSSDSLVFILSINDDSKKEVIQNLKLPKKCFVFHTSGALGMDILAPCHRPHGIFYPLQTFTNEQTIDFTDIPILIEGSEPTAVDILKFMGQSISECVRTAHSEDRQKLHVAAVFASNFTNRMLSAAQVLMNDTELDFEILKPLVLQSVRNAFSLGADAALTGPAKRGDVETIRKHKSLLEPHPDLQPVYDQLTQWIMEKKGSSS